MKWIMKSSSIQDYLRESKWIDFSHPKIQIAAQGLAERALKSLSVQDEGFYQDPEIAVAKACFHFVRDEIHHSFDVSAKDVTIKASEVLEKGHGLCYAKSHLLAALLRANGIPAAICYQYLRMDENVNTSLIVHALNAICPEYLGTWIRLDARGNTNGIDAQFFVDKEQVAFPVNPSKGETDLPFLFAQPDKEVIARMQASESAEDIYSRLPEKISGVYDE